MSPGRSLSLKKMLGFWQLFRFVSNASIILENLLPNKGILH